MDSAVRVLILTCTVIALIYILSHQPQTKYFPGQTEIPLLSNDPVDYCQITFKQAFQDHRGEWHVGFGPGYGPCYLLDRYEEI